MVQKAGFCPILFGAENNKGVEQHGYEEGEGAGTGSPAPLKAELLSLPQRTGSRVAVIVQRGVLGWNALKVFAAVAQLHLLRRAFRSGDADGAQRVCFADGCSAGDAESQRWSKL